MKKLVTLCLFVFALMFNAQTINAQDKFKATEERLKVESQELKKLMNLDDNQTAMVWRTMYAKEKAYFDQILGADFKNQATIELKERIDSNFKSKMMQILSEEQFKTFTVWLSKRPK